MQNAQEYDEEWTRLVFLPHFGLPSKNPLMSSHRKHLYQKEGVVEIFCQQKSCWSSFIPKIVSRRFFFQWNSLLPQKRSRRRYDNLLPQKKKNSSSYYIINWNPLGNRILRTFIRKCGENFANSEYRQVLLRKRSSTWPIYVLNLATDKIRM